MPVGGAPLAPPGVVAGGVGGDGGGGVAGAGAPVAPPGAMPKPPPGGEDTQYLYLYAYQ